ncbi:AraC family transcriptional regulator [Paraburkholderia aromaticivorans]|uniref:AraC family transcriptional regulator n=1 Tax=Paraburkholderia aromaticivorans TaxID=2026199 RepID=A0A248VQP7_9BURK|nr:AraC family transcriptional regulator [Paraburkholderia aromaticivorans]ASW01185.1 AraC family transcriptional regulator [Paraburkholderia aromaticivorans]
MKNDKGTISVSMVEEALALAHARGLDALPLAEAAGIAAPMLTSPKSRVSSAQYGALWAAIARALDDEFFGQDSHRMKSGSFIAMTQTALSARNGAQALARAVGFMRLVLDDLGVQVDTDAQRVRLRFVENPGAPPPAMFAYATYFILVYGLLCWLVGRRIPLLEARFRCAEPPAAHEYRLMFCDQMSFDQAESYVDLAPLFLDLPVIQTTKSVKPFLRDAPGSFIVKYRNPGSLAARVRKMLRAMPMAGWPSADQMADRLHVAEATMRRRLKQEGYTYQSIKDDLRRDIAIGELQDTDRTIADIATSVGFAEPSAFHRAFRKWTGMRPTDYRPARADFTRRAESD